MATSVDYTTQQFETLRNRARQSATAQTQAEQEGLKRRFAALGQANSGAQIRLESQAAERGAQRLQQAEEGIGMAEAQERGRLQEVREGREFARGERLGSQDFVSGQNVLGRDFQKAILESQQKYGTSERLGSQDFAAGQASESRKFATSERKAGQEYGLDVLGRQQKFATGEREAGQKFASGEREASQGFADTQLGKSQTWQAAQNDLSRTLQGKAYDLQKSSIDMAIKQWDLEFQRDSDTIEFNKRMAEQNAQNSGILGTLGLGNIDRGLSKIGISGSGAAGGAAIGAGIGSIVPGVGTAIGAGVGAAVGGLFG